MFPRFKCVYFVLIILRCLLFLVLYLLVAAEANTTDLNEMYGYILSPNFPEGYPSDSDITWNISVPLGFRIKLYFMHFDLEPSYLCEYDFVKSGAEQPLLFCGKERTDTEQTPGQQTIYSHGNTMSLTFQSDFSNEERFTGFKVHYAAEGE
uniref:CUB domain-containing protein n=1 Tax=Callorhinchus milii TaxID=7868 RepID=A0A4W3GM41_CALMI